MADAAATAAQRGDAQSEKTSANTQRWLQTLTDRLQDPDFVRALNELMGLETEAGGAEEVEGPDGA